MVGQDFQPWELSSRHSLPCHRCYPGERCLIWSCRAFTAREKETDFSKAENRLCPCCDLSNGPILFMQTHISPFLTSMAPKGSSRCRKDHNQPTPPKKTINRNTTSSHTQRQPTRIKTDQYKQGLDEIENVFWHRRKQQSQCPVARSSTSRVSSDRFRER